MIRGLDMIQAIEDGARERVSGPVMEYLPGGNLHPPRVEDTGSSSALVVPLTLPAGVSLFLDRDGVAWETAEPVTVSVYLDLDRLVAIARTAVRSKGRRAGRCRGLISARAGGRFEKRRAQR